MSYIERLQASKAQFESDVFADGWKFGNEWAKEDAEYGELLFLAGHELAADETIDSIAEIIGYPMDAILGDMSKVEAFTQEPRFCQGFVRGALCILEEVASEKVAA